MSTETREAPASLTEQVAAMARRMAQMEELVTAQQAEIERLRPPAPKALAPAASMPAGEPAAAAPETGTPAKRNSRRALLKLGGAAAAAGVAAVAASATELAHPGTAHAHSDTVTQTYTASGSGNIALEGSGTSGALGVYGSADGGYGVYGTSSNNGTGVVGDTVSSVGTGTAVLGMAASGAGVSGGSLSGYGGSFSGGLAPLSLYPASTAGAPTSSANRMGDIYIDANGVMWLCVVSGNSITNTKATWVRLAGVSSAAASGLTFQQSASGAFNVAIEGDGTSGAFGVIGTSDSVTGVAGTSSSGAGVVGNSTSQLGVHGISTHYVGVKGESTASTGVGGWFVGGRAALALGAGAAPGAPTAGQHFDGDIYLDSTFTLWVCIANGTPGTWVRLTSVANGVSGGALNYLTAPIRILDTRAGQPAPLPTTKGALMGGSTTTIQVTGTTVGGLSVPAGATGVFGNLTVTDPVNYGDLILFPHGAPQPLTSNINYGPGQTIANAVNVGLSTGGAMDLYVHVSTTDVIFDVAGYVV